MNTGISNLNIYRSPKQIITYSEV